MRDLLIKYRGNRTQEEMGKKYGVTQQAWNTWEKGLATPKPATMMQISLDSNMPMEQIFFDAFNKENLSNSPDEPGEAKAVGE